MISIMAPSGIMIDTFLEFRCAIAMADRARRKHWPCCMAPLFYTRLEVESTAVCKALERECTYTFALLCPDRFSCGIIVDLNHSRVWGDHIWSCGRRSPAGLIRIGQFIIRPGARRVSQGQTKRTGCLGDVQPIPSRSENFPVTNFPVKRSIRKCLTRRGTWPLRYLARLLRVRQGGQRWYLIGGCVHSRMLL
jgi:hypothetical protein